MTAYRLYNLFRRAGSSPCQAFRQVQSARPGVLESAAYYAVAVLLALSAFALTELG